MGANSNYSDLPESLRKQLVFRNKKEEVLSRFSADILNNNLQYDATFYSIIQSLSLGQDPYVIIEQLIINQNSLIKELIDLKNNGNHTIIIQKTHP